MPQKTRNIIYHRQNDAFYTRHYQKKIMKKLFFEKREIFFLKKEIFFPKEEIFFEKRKFFFQKGEIFFRKGEIFFQKRERVKLNAIMLILSPAESGKSRSLRSPT